MQLVWYCCYNRPRLCFGNQFKRGRIIDRVLNSRAIILGVHLYLSRFFEGPE